MRAVVLSISVFGICLFVSSLASAQATQAPQTLSISADRANMREKPSFDAAVVAVLPIGEQLDVLETVFDATGAWFRVRVKSTGRIGYVNQTVVKATGTLAPPAPATTPPNAPAARPAPRPAAEPPAPAAQPGARPQTTTRKPTTRTQPGIHAFGIADGEAMTASQSFEAVLGISNATVSHLGFGVEGTDLWNGLFVRFAYTHSSNTGTRVFVDSSLTAHSLNVPLTIEMTPIEIGGGWRFGSMSKGTVGLRPYLGGALLLQRYKETSPFASTDENTDITDTGAAGFGGVTIGVKFVRIGVEGQYRYIPNVIGAGGASLTYSETNLGGGVFRMTFGVGF